MLDRNTILHSNMKIAQLEQVGELAVSEKGLCVRTKLFASICLNG